VLRAASQETNVISIHKVCELQVPDLNPNSWSCGLQMVMQPIVLCRNRTSATLVRAGMESEGCSFNLQNVAQPCCIVISFS